MIIDLTVSNFLSIKNEQMLSFYADSNRSRLPENFSLFEDNKLAILRTCVILGSNASGKSNLLNAFAALKWMIVSSGSMKDKQKIPIYKPYKLNKDSINNPVSFEIEFIVKSGIRYRYEISFLEDKIISECLYSFAKRQKAVFFIRKENDTWENIKFGTNYKGGNKKFPFFSNNSYLSKAGNDASSPETIREIYNYFREMDFIFPNVGILMPDFFTDEKNINIISELIHYADTGISKIRPIFKENAPEVSLPANFPEKLKELIRKENSIEYKFSAISEDGEEVEFDKDDMSEGTIRLFGIIPIILNSLRNGTPLIVDEVDAHLHTHVLELIIKIFQNDEINKKGAQLIFTTHDTNIMASNRLRRDQIWLTSKDKGETSLTCLDEYDKKYVRPDSPFESFYREGRLGAVPNISFNKIKDFIIIYNS